MDSDAVPNALASRYATAPLRELWSARGRIRLERQFWIAVAKAQRELGLPIPEEAIEAYEENLENIDLEAIAARERVTRHDVKARLEEFTGLAGFEEIHKGMTSRDLTENVEQLQLFESLKLLRTRARAALLRLARLAATHRDRVLTARTHNVAAQPSTLGKRLAMFGEEFLGALQRFDQVIDTYPVRGLKGAVGTRLDQLSLFGNDDARVDQLEAAVAAHLGLPGALGNVGQVYPRSLDLRVIASFVEVAAAPSSFALTLRLMAGHELASEGFAPGQTGSSAMPHKVNSRSCERINALTTVLRGHLTMAAELAGNQWNEGDVSCSVVRRVLLPDACFALDGLLETLLTVLDQMEINDAVIEAELERYLPYLLTTTVLMESVKAGQGRETAHALVKEHALAAAKAQRSGGRSGNDLFQRLADDARVPLDANQLAEILAHGRNLTGSARAQVDQFVAAVDAYLADDSAARNYQPGAIL